MSGKSFYRGLSAKILVIPLIVFCLGILFPGLLGYSMLQGNAERETQQKAMMLLHLLTAAQRTADEGGGLPSSGDAGSPGSAVSQQIMRRYEAGAKNLSFRYRQVALKPGNAAERPDPYESRLLDTFNGNKSLNQIEEDIEQKGVHYHVIAVPTTLEHGQKVPMVGASVIYVPSDEAREQASQIFWTVCEIVALLALLCTGLLFWRTRVTVARPAVELLHTSQAIQRGEWGARFHVDYPDEMAALAMSFQNTTFWLREQVAKEEKLRSLFQQFIPASVAARALGKGNENILAGTRHSVSVMMINIRNFKLLMEHLPPEHTVTTLNEFFSEVNRVIVTHKGIVSKYLGDTVLAFFGMPVVNEDHALNAVRAALAIPPALQKLYVRLNDSYGWELGVGIGISTGEPIVGHFGSSEHMEYTVLGDVVGEAHRLESATKAVPEEDSIVISEATYRRVMSEVHVYDLGDREDENGKLPHAYVVQGFRSEARSVLVA